MDQTGAAKPKMTPTAYLIGRENVNNCSHQLLTTIVDRILQNQQRSFDLYTILISRKNDLTITKITKPSFLTNNKNLLLDEGFESDIDNASLLSSDGDSINFVDPKQKPAGSDSANSSSDSSDTESTVKQQQSEELAKQIFQLDSIVCYTNLRFPKIIGLVIVNNRKSGTNDFLIFEFLNTDGYDRIRYAFNSLNSQVINRNLVPEKSKKFNLVQRTDKNGVTHIEISRETDSFQEPIIFNQQQPSSIISINTPETHNFDYKTNLNRLRSNSQTDVAKLVSNSQSSVVQVDPLRSYDGGKSRSNGGKKEIDGVIRSDVDLVDFAPSGVNNEMKKIKMNESKLKKVWHSAEDILDEQTSVPVGLTASESQQTLTEQPKKPERLRRKQKGRAPPPPNIMKGQYIRVNVDPNKPITPNPNLKLATFESNKLDNYNSNWIHVASTQNSPTETNIIRYNNSTPPPTTYKTATQSTSEFRTDILDQQRSFTLNRRNRDMLIKNSERVHKWTNSVPRLPKNILPQQMMMIRSRSESNRYQKNNPYKYVDTTKSVPLIFNSSKINNNYVATSTHSSLPTVINNNLLITNSSSNSSISNRLFGLSQKLKEFSTNVVNTNHKFLNNQDYSKYRRNSVGELSYKLSSPANNVAANLTSRYGTGKVNEFGGGNLKSVIKKNESGHCTSSSLSDHHESSLTPHPRKNKNNNEKKVTFSAFATVQVV